jgi:hypothetical protein
MSPVEQIALTVNIALRRDASTLDHYRAGSSPDAFATLPNEWTADQIRSFQDYFDALMSGNLARRRQTKFMARRLQADRGAPAASEGPVRRMAGAHHLLRLLASRRHRRGWCRSRPVIQECMKEPALEFVWVGDDAIDPIEQAQTTDSSVSTA